MSDDLYAKELLRWAADASRAGHLPDPKRAATANNAMCGDKVTMEFVVDPTHEIMDCRHDTKACVLTQASAAIIAECRVEQVIENLAIEFGLLLIVGLKCSQSRLSGSLSLWERVRVRA